MNVHQYNFTSLVTYSNVSRDPAEDFSGSRSLKIYPYYSPEAFGKKKIDEKKIVFDFQPKSD